MLRMLRGRSTETQLDINIAFVSYEKVSYKVKHEILMNDLKIHGIDEKIFGY